MKRNSVTQPLRRSLLTWRSSAGIFIALSTAYFNIAALPALAQTEFEPSARSETVASEFYQELDTWMLRAYEGDRDAQFKVGVLFASDQLEKPNAEQAVYWYMQAARQGHILAQYNLGHHLLTGNGVEKDDAGALEWWKKAAIADHALAQFNVGRAYYLGIGVAEDHEQSRYWFSRAAQNKEPKSVEVMQQLDWEIDLISHNPDQTGAHAERNNTTESADSIDQEPATQATTDQGAQQISTSPVALYTDPAIRSVLISIINDRSSIDIVDINQDWITVRSSAGFPVWVYQDYLTIEDELATVVGNNVNARSVPIISKGTIAGNLNNGQELVIIDKQNDWYRLVSPSTFTAWVKTEDYNRSPSISTQSGNDDDDSLAIEPNSTTTLEPKTTPETNDNAWLFSQPKENYTLQLASFDDEQKISSFISSNNFSDDTELHRFTATAKDIAWTYFLYGNYDTVANAEAAKTNIRQSRAWTRSFGRLQENRCLSWKTKLPTPPELNQYCNQ